MGINPAYRHRIEEIVSRRSLYLNFESLQYGSLWIKALNQDFYYKWAVKTIVQKNNGILPALEIPSE
jgi:hypothetical protein